LNSLYGLLLIREIRATMNTQKLKTTSIVAALAIASIALIVGLSQTETITAQSAPTGNAMYPFAEDVYPSVTFEFRDATVTYDFQLFDTTNNLFTASAAGSNFVSAKQIAPEFVLQRIVGKTPYLHQAVDQSFEWGGRNALQDYSYKEFDITVDMVQKGQVLRTFEYADCGLTNYKIKTEFDKAESFTGRDAFANLEQYTFVCAGYSMSSPVYDQMMEEQQNRKPYQ
jgi:hypothetical protein